jgi:hypothetical protein
MSIEIRAIQESDNPFLSKIIKTTLKNLAPIIPAPFIMMPVLMHLLKFLKMKNRTTSLHRKIILFWAAAVFILLQDYQLIPANL